MLAKCAVTAAGSHRVRFSSGILTIAIFSSPNSDASALRPQRVEALTGPSNYLQQELQDLKVALCLTEILAPTVEAMAPQQKSMSVWMLRQRPVDDPSQPCHVLVVFNNGQPLAMRVRLHALQPFQHLVTFNPYAALGRVKLRNYCAPDRVGMQHSASLTRTDDHQVQCCLSGRLPRSLCHGSVSINLHKLVRSETALVQSSGGDCYAERITAYDSTEISACPQRPAPGVEGAPQLSQEYFDF